MKKSKTVSTNTAILGCLLLWGYHRIKYYLIRVFKQKNCTFYLILLINQKLSIYLQKINSHYDWDALL